MANVLGINLSEFSQKEVLEKIVGFLMDNNQHYLVTPNPEIILAAEKDEEFFYVLNQADLSLADGVGLLIAGRLFGKKIPRVTGSDLTVELLKLAVDKKIRVMILNWDQGLSTKDEITNALNQKFPGLIFLVMDINRDINLTSEKIASINNFAPQIIFNALGFPYQEKSIYYNLKKLPSVSLALGIGGSFDFLTGKSKRAPLSWRRLGLEWLWRLLGAVFSRRFNRRFKRIWNATAIFLFKIFRVRFIYPFLYRPNVACLLYRKNEGRPEILIIQRKDNANHWQLPQGGTDGESLEIAGLREIQEELGTKAVITKATFKNVHRYLFGMIRKHGPSDTFTYNHKGQKQGLFIGEFTGKAEEIKLNFWEHTNYKWVEPDKFLAATHPCRRAGYEKFLEKFKSLNIN